MKKLMIFFVLFSVVLLFGDEIIKYNFVYPRITETGNYNEINYEGCLNLGNEGDPALPLFAANLLLRGGEAAQEVEVLSISYYEDVRTLKLKPAGKPVPLSKLNETEYQLWESGVYEQEDSYPSGKISALDTGYLCGHPIASFTVCPVEYIPLTGETRFIESIELKIQTGNNIRSEASQVLLRHDKQVRERLSRLVDNLSAIDYYSETPASRPGEYDILLITSDALEDEFAEYIEFLENNGYFVATLTVEEIIYNYIGDDEQEAIRNAIIDYYQNYNTSYVILGGDSAPDNGADDLIPHRGFYCAGGGETDYDIPADMYYACLDGTWNDDNDNMWGESNEADLYAEVSVGRICVDSAQEIEQQTHKLMMYANNPAESSLEEFLMIGEYLWPGTYGGQYMNEVANGGDSNGYYTEGFSDNINVNTLYEMDNDWTSNDLYNALNSGVNMVHHLGHGNPMHCFNIEESDLTTTNLTNNGIISGYYTAYSQACYSGSFDNRDFSPGSYNTTDCFCEKITTMLTGASSFIGNSRYGWGQQGSTNGASQYFHRQYADAIFGEDIYKIGDANNDSKDDNVAYINSDVVIRWCCYELNLFGDPTMDVRTAIPEDMEVSVDAAVPIGTDVISVSTNVAGARVAVLQWGELLGRGETDAGGELELQLEELLTDPEPLEIVITAHNYNIWEGVIIVISDIAYIIYESHTINEIEGNGNGLADYGESLSLDLELFNLGNQPAAGVELVVNSADEYVEFIDNTETVGMINANTIVELAEAVSFIIADDVPDQHEIEFDLTVSDDIGNQWNSDFGIMVNAPSLVYAGLEINDSVSGNNNGILDPGETAEVSFYILNNGHSQSPAAELQLTSSNTEITILEQSVPVGEISADETVTGSFTLEISSEIAIGTPVEFTLVCVCGNYTIMEEFENSVGIFKEDFESGDFGSFDWEFDGDADWTIDEQGYEGEYSARSGVIDNSDESILKLELDVLFDADLSFIKKVSSESGSDHFRFYLDGEMLGEWSGNVEWSEESYHIRYGHHTLEWVYMKNYNSSNGDDCAWLDYIIFPPIGVPSAPVMYADPEVVNLECNQGDIIQSELQLSNIGGGTILYSVRTEVPGMRDVSNCYIENSTMYFEPGESATWVFTVYNESLDNEWIQGVDLQFPEGVIVEDGQDFVVDYNRRMYWDGVTGDGVLTTWFGTYLGSGALRNNEQTSAALDVSVSETFTGILEIDYMIYGDGYGNEPHTVSNTLELTYPLSWIALDVREGSLNGNEIDPVLITIDAGELEAGVYQCDIVVSSGDIAADFHVPVNLTVISSETPQNEIPITTQLTGCYPNPFNPETNITYELAETSPVTLGIYNIKGQLVKTLVNTTQAVGRYQVVWTGDTETGRKSASGVYFYRLQTRTCDEMLKMSLLK